MALKFAHHLNAAVVIIIALANALMILVLTGILLGAYFEQFSKDELPCPLCMLQRLSMIGVSVGGLLNLKFGIRTSHYGLSLISAIIGGGVALRQICLHICPGFPTFGVPVLGLSLYTWSFIAFSCVILAISLLLFLYDPVHEIQEKKKKIKMRWFSKLAFLFIGLATSANVITTLIQCGLTACKG